MNIVFMGSPTFAVPTLNMLGQHFNVVGVFTQPPKPKGRGHKVLKTPVHEAAEAAGIDVFTPKTLRKGAGLEALQNLAPDYIVVAAYGLMLPKLVIELPTHKCLNVHGSLLPRWRGAAPLHHAMLAGDTETGITIMEMDEGLDTGDMLYKEALHIAPNTTYPALHDDMAQLGADMMLKVLQNPAAYPPQKQDDALATYANKLTKEDGRLNWQDTAQQNLRKVQAMNPWPGAWFEHKGAIYKVLAAEVAETSADSPFEFPCTEGVFCVTRIQRAGGKPMEAADFMRGHEDLFKR